MADGSVIIDTKLDTSGAKKGLGTLNTMLSKVGGGMKTAFGIGAKALAGVTAGVVALGKSAVSSYADYEQLEGGVKKIFGKSAQQVIENAKKAYKTAGVSANQYMQQVTSFSASLIQSTAGDTAKAAKVADMALQDMADNANTFGTDMASIQNAYQGFAKQNYTMLDNLKLGYGGTKTEMERLLKDAQKLTGVKYDINNLSDVYNAIHAIQVQTKVTGTTAKEAMTTISGSVASMKAAWDNFLNGSGKFDTFVEQAVTAINNIVSAVNKLLPDIINGIVKGLPALSKSVSDIIGTIIDLVAENAPAIIDAVGDIVFAISDAIIKNLPKLLDAGGKILMKLLEGITKAIPKIMEVLPQIIQSIVNFFTNNIEQIVQMGVQILVALMNGLTQAIPQIIAMLPTIITTIVNTLLDNIDLLVDAGIQLTLALVDGLVEAIPVLIEKLPEIIEKMVQAIIRNLPKIIEAGVKIIIKLAEGLIKAIPKLVEAIPKIIASIVNGIGQLLGKIFEVGGKICSKIGEGIKSGAEKVKEIATNIGNGIKDKWNAVKSKAQEIGGNIVNGLRNGINNMKAKATEIAQKVGNGIKKVFGKSPKEMLEIGKNMIKGLWNGIQNVTQWVIDKIKGFSQSILDGIKSFFGIHSPSKVMEDQVGKNIALGVIKGVDGQKKNAKKSAEELAKIYITSANKRIKELEKTNSITLDQEKKLWEEMLKHAKKGTAEYKTIQNNIKKTKQEIIAEQNSALSESQKLTEEYTKNIADIRKKADEEIAKLWENYDNTIKSRVQSIMSSLKLFDEFKPDEALSGSQLTSNLETQVNALEEWDSILDILEQRIDNKELLEELQSQGVSSLETLKSLNDLSDEELDRYVELYERKQAIALERAKAENTMLLEQTKAEAEAIQKNSNEQMEQLRISYVTGLNKIAEDAKKAGINVGTKITQGIKNGISSGLKDVEKYLKTEVENLVKSAQTTTISADYGSVRTVTGVSGSLGTAKTYATAGSNTIREITQVTQNFYDTQASPYQQQRQAINQLRGLAYGLQT